MKRLQKDVLKQTGLSMPKSKRNLYILAAAALLFIFASIYYLFIFQKNPNSVKVDNSAAEVKPISDVEIAKRPFISLSPTATGSEIIISIENMAEFENIEYELTYMADNPQIPGEKIQRGSTGTDIDTKADKYKKSLLLGTASRGAASPDRGITDGKLTMHMFKGDTEYLSETKWDLFEIGLATNSIQDKDGNIKINLPKLTKNYFAILTDTVGLPKGAQFDPAKAKLPVFGVYSTAPKFPKKATLMAKAPSANSKLYVYNQQDGTWGSHDTTYKNGNLQTEIEFFATFVVVSQ